MRDATHRFVSPLYNSARPSPKEAMSPESTKHQPRRATKYELRRCIRAESGLGACEEAAKPATMSDENRSNLLSAMRHRWSDVQQVASWRPLLDPFDGL